MFPLKTLNAYEHSNAFVPMNKNAMTLRKTLILIVIRKRETISIEINLVTMRLKFVVIYQFLNFYTFSLNGQCHENSKEIILKNHANWTADLYAFNLVNIKNVKMEKLSDNVMVMHCKKASIKYLGGVEQIGLNLTCNAKATCGQNCISECLKIYESSISPVLTRKVSNYAHQNYMVLQQRIFQPENLKTAITVYADNYDVWLDNQYKFLKVRIADFKIIFSRWYLKWKMGLVG